MSPRVSTLALLVSAAAVLGVGCGGRLLELGDPEGRGVGTGHGSGTDATSPVDAGDAGEDANAGEDSGPDASPNEDAAPPNDPCRGLPTPDCYATPTCGSMYLRPGEGLATGDFNFETIFVGCPALPTIVQQQINGVWTQLASLENPLEPGTPSPNTYIIGSEYPLSSPQAGATIGSVQSIRACTQTGQCLTCDPPQSISVPSCGACLPKDCGPGKFLDTECNCAVDICPCPRDTYPSCTTPSWQCW